MRVLKPMLQLLVFCFACLISNVVYASESSQNAGKDNAMNASINADTAEEPDLISLNKAQFALFPSFGMGFRGGLSFQEHSINNLVFDTSDALGFQIDLSVFSFGLHSAHITAGYFHFGNDREKGTAEIKVKTSFQRLDLALTYQFDWKIIIVKANVGGALTLLSIETVYGEPGYFVDLGEGSIQFFPPSSPVYKNRTGADAGFLAGLGVGIEIGQNLLGLTHLLELTVQSDWVRRGARDEFTLYALISFHLDIIKTGTYK